MGYSLRMHAGFDAVLLALTLAAPWLFGYSHYTAATLYSLAIVLAGVLVNGITDYPLGLWRKLAFRWHRLIEFSSVLPFIAVPWLFFADSGAMPYVISVLGVGVVVNAALAQDVIPAKAETRRASSEV